MDGEPHLLLAFLPIDPIPMQLWKPDAQLVILRLTLNEFDQDCSNQKKENPFQMLFIPDNNVDPCIPFEYWASICG